MNTAPLRCEDFEWRATSNPDAVYIHRSRGWRYIPIHPFPDEPNVLERLSLTPNQCLWTDAYWAVDDDVVFLEVISAEVRKGAFGLYLRTRSEGGNVALGHLPDAHVSRARFEEIMAEFYDSGKLLEPFPDRLTAIKEGF